jgi:flavin-dependent dehydrogenase
MYDAIIVGARCAGASTAMLLARKGHKVLLVDRSAFPSDIPHGHLIHRHGPKRLKDWGLLDRIVATGSPPITEFSSDYGGLTLTGRELHLDGVAVAYAPRRIEIDKALINAAIDAGAEFRPGFMVEEFASSDGAITGVRGHGIHHGSAHEERARITIGADGRNSRLARTVNAPKYEACDALTGWYFSYWSGVNSQVLEIHERDGTALFAFPTNDGLFAIFIGWERSKLERVLTSPEAEFMAVIDAIPSLAERVRAGHREERLRGVIDLPNFLRKSFGDGWALVGDAGCHKDPYLALGMCDALRDAELLANAIDDGLSGGQAMPDALRDYEQRRNEATLPDYRQNLDMARFSSMPPEQIGLRAALQHDQAATNQFYMAIEGMIPPESFFNPENMQRLFATSANSSATAH